MYTAGALGIPQRSLPMTIAGTGAIFDVDAFDESVFASDSVSRLKRRIAEVAHNYRYRVRHYEANRQLVLLRLGCEAHILTNRRT